MLDKKNSSYQQNKVEILNKAKRKHTGQVGSEEHEIKKARKRLDFYEKKKSKTCIDKFNEKLKDGPFHVCVCCNRALYRHSVKVFLENNYSNEIENFYFAHVNNDDGTEFICRTCDSSLKKGKKKTTGCFQ